MAIYWKSPSRKSLLRTVFPNVLLVGEEISGFEGKKVCGSVRYKGIV